MQFRRSSPRSSSPWASWACLSSDWPPRATRPSIPATGADTGGDRVRHHQCHQRGHGAASPTPPNVFVFGDPFATSPTPPNIVPGFTRTLISAGSGGTVAVDTISPTPPQSFPGSQSSHLVIISIQAPTRDRLAPSARRSRSSRPRRRSSRRKLTPALARHRARCSLFWSSLWPERRESDGVGNAPRASGRGGRWRCMGIAGSTETASPMRRARARLADDMWLPRIRPGQGTERVSVDTPVVRVSPVLPRIGNDLKPSGAL